jgi:hypothetical protein
VDHKYKIENTEYTLRELSWVEDLDLQQKCITKDGQIDIKELMVLRVTRSIVEPKLLTDDVRQLSSKVGSTLNMLWLKDNDVNPSSFLEIPITNDT